jgi:hypothetical protein
MQKSIILKRLGPNLLKEYSPKDADIIAQDICLAIRGANTPKLIDKAMNTINKLIKGYGVETIRHHGSHPYWQDCGLIYVNQGDNYTPTIIYDTRKEKWFCTDWGTLVEAQPRRFR